MHYSIYNRGDLYNTRGGENFDAKICGNENYGSLQEQYGQYGLALALSCGDEM